MSQRRKEQADLWVKQGLEHYKSSQLQAAIAKGQKALQRYRELHEQQGQAIALNLLGNAFMMVGDYDAATECHHQLLTLARELQNPQTEIAALGSLAIVYQERGEIQTAIQYSKQSLKLAQQVGYRVAEMSALSNLGRSFFVLGEYEKAIDYQKRSLAIARKLKDRSEGVILGCLGDIYLALGDYSTAIQYQQQHVKIAQKLNSEHELGTALGDLANVYYVLGDYDEAMSRHQQHLEIARRVGDLRGQGMALGNIGIVWDALGEYDQAIEYHQYALQIMRQVGDQHGEIKGLLNIATGYLRLDDDAQAIEMSQQSLKLAVAIGEPALESLSLGSLAIASYYMGKYRDAAAYAQQSLTIAQKIGDRPTEAQALMNLGVSHTALQNYAQATEFYQRSLSLMQSLNNRIGQGQVLNNLGRLFFLMRQFEQAEQYLNQSIEIWEEVRHSFQTKDNFKVSIFETQARTYRLLQQTLNAQGRTEQSLIAAEQGRARTLVELLTAKIKTESQEVETSFTETISIDQIKQISSSQNSVLIEYSIIYDAFDEILEGRRSRESELLIWVIQPSGEIHFEQVDLKFLWREKATSLEKLVLTTLESLEAYLPVGIDDRDAIRLDRAVETESYLSYLEQLYQVLIHPIIQFLPQNSDLKLIFIPQGFLFFVPFAALKNREGKFLIVEHTIAIAPSIQALALSQKQYERLQNQSRKALVVGNPTMPMTMDEAGNIIELFSPLPWAESEAKTVASLLKTRAVVGSQATKRRVMTRMTKARIIHLATHGVLGDVLGIELPGAIVLAPTQRDNGLLSAEEILSLQLQAELVVLSACDTGTGRLSGDGVLGLSRAFILAGVATVLVTLWSIPDAPTATIMIEFHQYLQQNYSKAKALRQAMLNAVERDQHPKTWASFVVVGSPH